MCHQERNQEGDELNDPNQVLPCADDVNLLSGNVHEHNELRRIIWTWLVHVLIHTYTHRTLQYFVI